MIPPGKQKHLLTVAVSFWLLFKFWTYLRRKWRLQTAIQARKDEQKLNFEKVSNFFEGLPVEKSQEILALSFNQLKGYLFFLSFAKIFSEHLQSGKVNCVDALRAYQRKAMEVTERTNCVCLFVEVRALF